MPSIIVRRQESKYRERSVKLEQAQPGGVVRFAETAFEVALKENQFFIVCKPADKKGKEKDKSENEDKRIRLCGFDGTVVERDPDRLVVEHTSIFEVEPTPDSERERV